MQENAFINQNKVTNQNLAYKIDIPELDVNMSWEMPTTSREYSSVQLDVPPLVYMTTTNNPQPATDPPTNTKTKSVTVGVAKKKENKIRKQPCS